jgi:aryl-alcohol dehydrogenase-like predicted oxidoreductase
VHQGKIRAFGCSSFPAEDIVESHHVAERRGFLRFRTEQPPYSVLARGIEKSVLPVCQRYGMGVLTYSPLASGFLSGKYRKGRPVDMTTGRPTIMAERFDPENPGNNAKYDAVEKLADIAEGIGCTLAELAVAFVAAHPGVTSAIIGPRTMEQLEQSLKGASLTLDDETLDRIDEVVPPGTDLFRADGAWRPHALTAPELRRRPLRERAAG